VKKEAELCDKRITVVSEGLKELKAVHKKEIQDLTLNNYERVEDLQKAFKEKVREAYRQTLKKTEMTAKKSATNRVFITGLSNICKKKGITGGDITSVVYSTMFLTKWEVVHTTLTSLPST